MKLFSIKLYHGTPHEFDEFDTKHIGSGEGAQIHGWGLYFTSNKEIAIDRYAKRLGEDYWHVKLTVDDKTITFPPSTIYNEYTKNVLPEFPDFPETVYRNLRNWDFYEDKYDVIGRLKSDINFNRMSMEKEGDISVRHNTFGYVKYSEIIKICEDMIKWCESHDVEIDSVDAPTSVFTIEVPDDLVFAEESLHISEQSDKVQEAIEQYCMDKFRREGKSIDELSDYMKRIQNYSFGFWYGSVTGTFRKNISLALEELGVDGITYNGGTDGRCYVIFNPNKITIVEKESM